MHLFKQLKREHLLPLIVTLILTVYQLIRVIAFINVYGGIEHDGGWMLGISRSLAERGSYTSMYCLLEDPTVQAAVGVDGRFAIQDSEGRHWFLTSGVGPASIVPDAVILKIFGFGFWALRAGPLVFYVLALILTAYLLYKLAGTWAIALFHAFLFCYPRLTIFLSYEAMGEVPALFYIVWAYLAFAVATQKQHRRLRHFLVAGLIAGVAISTKLLVLLAASGILIWAFYLLVVDGGKLRLREVVAMGGGAALVLVVWELAIMLSLIRLTSFAIYLRHVQQRLEVFFEHGSGLRKPIHSGAEFIWRKFFLLREVAHPQPWVTALVFVGILLGGLALLWLWRSERQKRALLASIWLGWLVNVVWFVGIGQPGWPRHFWIALMLTVLLLSFIPIVLIQRGWSKVKQEISTSGYQHIRQSARPVSMSAAGMLLLILIGWGLVSQPYVWGFFLPDEIVPYWQEKRFDYLDSVSLPWIIIPRSAQAEVVDYINHMPPEANVYYPAYYKAAEIPPQTGRINYPLNRRAHSSVTPHPADVVLVPPAMISPWKAELDVRQALIELVERSCPNPMVKNDYYVICVADEVIMPE